MASPILVASFITYLVNSISRLVRLNINYSEPGFLPLPLAVQHAQESQPETTIIAARWDRTAEMSDRHKTVRQRQRSTFEITQHVKTSSKPPAMSQMSVCAGLRVRSFSICIKFLTAPESLYNVFSREFNDGLGTCVGQCWQRIT